MTPFIQLKQTRSIFVAAFGLVCFALSSTVGALNPAPDGGYAGWNTAEGQNALFSFPASGFYNTALGGQALYHDTSGNKNTAVGINALYTNNVDGNTAVGFEALFSNANGIS